MRRHYCKQLGENYEIIRTMLKIQSKVKINSNPIVDCKKEFAMKDLFQLDPVEVQELETLLTNSPAVEPATLEGMNNQGCGDCGMNCSGSCGDGCTGNSSNRD